MGSEITIFGPEEPDLESGRDRDLSGDRGIIDDFRRLASGQVTVDDLTAQMEEFIQSMRAVFGTLPDSLGDFQIETLELTAEVSTKGKISLLGSGGQIGGQGGLKFVLKRNRPQDKRR